MQELNLPKFAHRIKVKTNERLIFDPISKKNRKLTPEEWVRQNFIWFLHDNLNYPLGLLSVEMQLKLNNLIFRSDIVAFNNTGKPLLIVECKAPHITINQKVFDQIATYNLKLNVDFLVVTNGLSHYCCYMDYKNNSYYFLEDIPNFKQAILSKTPKIKLI